MALFKAPAKKEEEKIEFYDVRVKYKNHPRLFSFPSQKDLNALQAGDSVKVGICKDYFWVDITEVNGDRIKGTACDDVSKTDKHKIRIGSRIEILKQNVLAIIKSIKKDGK